VWVRRKGIDSNKKHMKNVVQILLLIFLFNLFSKSFAQDSNQDFNSFSYKFFSDSTSQIESIKFPLIKIIWNSETDDFDTSYVKSTQWIYSDFNFFKNNFNVQLYDSFQKSLRNTNERVISFEGVENGMQLNLYFKYSSSKWWLIKLEDFSD
jgi:hypothetical protein